MRAKAPQKGLSFFNSFSLSRSVHSIPFATVDVEEISGSQPAEVHNLVQGKWKTSSNWNTLLDPLNGEPFIKVAEVDETGIQPFVESLSKCPKHGLHNPFKAPERYLLFGDISVKAAHMLSIPKISDFFTRLIQRVAPKSYKQALGEVYVTQKFFENFSGDQVRFLARSFAVPGDHLGQQSHGFRWPYGPPFVESLSKCPKHGLHNPFKAPERYLLFGDVSVKAAHMLSIPKISDFFTRLIQRVAPKSYKQALGEVYVTQKFFENFSGDQVRFLARSFAVPGDHLGQQSHGFRWPYGPVAIITPFNFPLEIPVLQLMGALYMGNKPILKVDSKVSIVMEQMMRLLHYCGLPAEDVDFINSDGKTMNKILLEGNPRMTLFTGSSRVADKLAVDLKGRIKLEDAGFDWKVLGPDVQEEDYVAWVCDQDAYACSGQKCSAQSILFMHENWSRTSIISKIKNLAERRKLEDLTVGPVLTFTTEAMLEHLNKLLQIPGSKLLFGGKPLKNHSIPSIYGAIKPTAVYVPLEEIMKENNYELVTREIFGPFQIITDYKKEQLPMVLDALERMHAHLTAAVVSNDPLFLQEVIGKTVNGTTYAGLRARTTGAPQNHWFGPAGDPRGAGIGTPEAIKLVWSCHREIIYDIGPVPRNWEIPPST
nr:putative aldehyde dehydrogenase [Quercus suber]